MEAVACVSGWIDLKYITSCALADIPSSAPPLHSSLQSSYRLSWSMSLCSRNYMIYQSIKVFHEWVHVDFQVRRPGEARVRVAYCWGIIKGWLIKRSVRASRATKNESDPVKGQRSKGCANQQQCTGSESNFVLQPVIIFFVVFILLLTRLRRKSQCWDPASDSYSC